MKTETITWHELPADGMPDADLSVLAAFTTGADPVADTWVAWWTGEHWIDDATGDQLERDGHQRVRAWADLPGEGAQLNCYHVTTGAARMTIPCTASGCAGLALSPDRRDELLAEWQTAADRALAYRTRPAEVAALAFLAGIEAAESAHGARSAPTQPAPGA